MEREGGVGLVRGARLDELERSLALSQLTKEHPSVRTRSMPSFPWSHLEMIPGQLFNMAREEESRLVS